MYHTKEYNKVIDEMIEILWKEEISKYRDSLNVMFYEKDKNISWNQLPKNNSIYSGLLGYIRYLGSPTMEEGLRFDVQSTMKGLHRL